MSERMETLFAFLYGLRCRLGAWLLREHVGALCERYNLVSRIAAAKDQPVRKERVDYIGIGLCLTVRGPWLRFDEENERMLAEAAEGLEHAGDAL